MGTVPHIAEAMQKVLGEVARAAGKMSGFIIRERKLDGASFVQGLVFGWLGNPEATLEELSQVSGIVGERVSRQALDQGFGPAAAETMRLVLEAAVSQVVRAEELPERWLDCFEGVYLRDSTVVMLPEGLRERWEGCGGGRTGQSNAAIKLSVRWDYQRGRLEGPTLHAARVHDQHTPAHTNAVEAGSLQLMDAGYFDLHQLACIQQQDAYWIIGYKAGVRVYSRKGTALDLPTFLSAQASDCLAMAIQLGAQQRLACRMVAQRMPVEIVQQRRDHLQQEAQREGKTVSPEKWLLAAWTIFLTNVPPTLLRFEHVFCVARVRWQIELLFKLWKSEGRIDEWRSSNPWRILTELYAKLIAAILQHWLLLLAGWNRPQRSLTQATRLIRRLAWAFAWALPSPDLLALLLLLVQAGLSTRASISASRSHPRTFQLLCSLT